MSELKSILNIFSQTSTWLRKKIKNKNVGELIRNNSQLNSSETTEAKNSRENEQNSRVRAKLKIGPPRQTKWSNCNDDLCERNLHQIHFQEKRKSLLNWKFTLLLCVHTPYRPTQVKNSTVKITSLNSFRETNTLKKPTNIHFKWTAEE